MILNFNIEYYTDFGQRLYVVLDNGRSQAMIYGQNGKWFLTIEIPTHDSISTYSYELRTDDGTQVLRSEWGRPHALRAEASVNKLTLFDAWSEKPALTALYSSFFTRCIFRRHKPAPRIAAKAGYIMLCVDAPTLASDELLAVMGDSPATGEWHADRAPIMSDADAPAWSILLPAEVAATKYKFVVLDRATKRLKYIEYGDDRIFPAPLCDSYADDTASAECRLRMRDDRAMWHGAGVAIPVFSLRSRSDWGCGEFADLRFVTDWAAATGMSVIQLLPVNDTCVSHTWRDSYPYNSVSAFALHPIYLNARDAAQTCASFTDDATIKQINDLTESYATTATTLNELKQVDYEAVMELKTSFLHRLYALCGEKFLRSDKCRHFEQSNACWLLPYCVFSALRDNHSTADSRLWGEMSIFNDKKVAHYAATHGVETGFYKFTQFLLDGQLRSAHDYAAEKGVALKGDIAIGVSPMSADVWQHPDLFNTTMSAGAPPDDFSADGQCWGFPTYNWSRMAADGYAWWRARLHKMSEYFDAYRIDHILGFFRIWEVPHGAVSAVLGHFNQSLAYTADEIRGNGFPFDRTKHAAEDMSSADVLFVKYPYAEASYVPRIDGCKSAAFALLSHADKEAYKRLYDDFYYRRNDDMWRKCALERLPALISATDMLTCGEDLGMIPACVPEVMQTEQILSLEIQRMPKRYGALFDEPADYPYLSVATTSTHDTSTLRGWWREDRSKTQYYYSEMLQGHGEAPTECTGAIAGMIIEKHLESDAMLTILPLQDWLATDESLRSDDPDAERINVPADADNYWHYRMHIDLESLIEAKEFNTMLRLLTDLRRK